MLTETGIYELCSADVYFLIIVGINSFAIQVMHTALCETSWP